MAHEAVCDSAARADHLVPGRWRSRLLTRHMSTTIELQIHIVFFEVARKRRRKTPSISLESGRCGAIAENGSVRLHRKRVSAGSNVQNRLQFFCAHHFDS